MPNLSRQNSKRVFEETLADKTANNISALSSVGTLAGASVPNATAKRRLAFGGATLRAGKQTSWWLKKAADMISALSSVGRATDS